ncbi:hypothetical protein [Accumulibacter sp.]|nr:hypothetical protein [Accumulibacter sp.]HRI92006.1 hypothetical protein [Accumulibacter sp.]
MKPAPHQPARQGPADSEPGGLYNLEDFPSSGSVERFRALDTPA